MVDPRLNSVHLEMPRRQEFRRARDLVLESRGCETIDGEQRDSTFRPPTAIERFDERGIRDVHIWLIDSDYVYPLYVGLNTLGRAPDNDIVLQDGYISRRHCTIVVHANDRVELFDTASKNGTYINGHRLHRPTCLKTGDEIRMCDHPLVFMSQGAADQAPETDIVAHD